MVKQEKPLKLLHPDDDGTWVEFHAMSPRQKEVLEAYEVMAVSHLRQDVMPLKDYLNGLRQYYGRIKQR